MSEAALAARGVTKRFGRAAALREIDLEVPPGSCLAVVGPNGAGKSTLLRLWAGLARPSSGEARVADLPATHRESRARVGYLGHASLLSPPLTVRENLLFTARLYGVPCPDERVAALLESDALADIAARRADALSRGQAQRAAIARSRVHEPSVLLLDEPYTGLDRGAAAQLTQRLGQLREAGVTAVLVTHDLDAVQALADNAAVLETGRLVWTGAARSGELERAFEAALERGRAA
ncbi:MAG: ABC transporter ATP-binding protein [Myxococcota bacterium]